MVDDAATSMMVLLACISTNIDYGKIFLRKITSNKSCVPTFEKEKLGVLGDYI